MISPSLIFVVSVAVLYWVHDGYLRALVLMRKPRPTNSNERIVQEHLPVVTVLLAVHNERDVIERRIADVLSQDYPADHLEMIVASDGSDDGTDEAVIQLNDSRVRLVRVDGRGGKTVAQNVAIQSAKGEIVVFTDAGTSFDSNFLRAIVEPFCDPAVGGAGGHLLFKESGTTVAPSQGRYWRYELRVRELESEAGILAVASGACVAIRHSLFRPMDPAYGEDCVLPLDIVSQGYRIVHALNARAFDTMRSETKREFRARVRMTMRNWQGTWSYSALLDPLRYPGISVALWSHKVLRWLSPFFLLAAVLSANFMWSAGAASAFVAALTDIFCLLGALGAFAAWAGLRVPVADSVFSFFLANLGFFVGVMKALYGHKITAYQ